MTAFVSLSIDQLHKQYAHLLDLYKKILEQGLSLDLSRGVPSTQQLDIAQELLFLPGDNYLSSSKIDCRNYGYPRGLPELAKIFAPILPAPANNILPCSNSSLEIMQSVILASLFTTPIDGQEPWLAAKIKFLCPVPGYDRHFALTNSLGIEMIPIPMTELGPDMDLVESYVTHDPQIKGIWIVPVYSNPTGITISEENTRRLATMPTAAKDFRIFWDNAYAVHTLVDSAPIRDIFSYCTQMGNENRIYIFASTSKITFAGAGVAFFGASAYNLDWYLTYRNFGLICPDKLNQLRHVQYLKNTENVYAIMQKHRAIIKPKFDLAIEVFNSRLSGPKVAHWNNPEGGYFIGLYVLEGTAKRIVELAAKAGILLTPAGAAFPYGKDPRDEFIRLAFTCLSHADITTAADSIATCVLLAAAEKLIEEYSR